jgi:hypothetical protein
MPTSRFSVYALGLCDGGYHSPFQKAQYLAYHLLPGAGKFRLPTPCRSHPLVILQKNYLSHLHIESQHQSGSTSEW